MEYTDIVIADNQYEVQDEARKAGLEDVIGIIQPEIVEEWPEFGATVVAGINASEALVTATGAFTWKAGKKPAKLQCIIEKLSGETKLLGRSTYESDFKITVQNTPENRGIFENLRKVRFCAYLKEFDGDGILLGKPGVSTSYLAQVKADSYSEKTGEKFNDDTRMIEFVITAKPYRPYAYQETFSFAPGQA